MRKVVFITLVMLSASLLAAPLSAICVDCVRAGIVCNSEGWCEEVYVCRSTSEFCASCWLSCRESTAYGGCFVSGSCYWAWSTDEHPELRSSPELSVPMASAS
jgi:hypothetical protein